MHIKKSLSKFAWLTWNVKVGECEKFNQHDRNPAEDVRKND